MNRVLRGTLVWAISVLALSLYRAPAQAAASFPQSPVCGSGTSLSFAGAPAVGTIVAAVGGEQGSTFSGQTASLGGNGAMTQRLQVSDAGVHSAALWDIQVTSGATATVTFSASTYYCIYNIGTITAYPGAYASGTTLSGQSVTTSGLTSASGDGLIAGSWANNNGTGALTISSGTNVSDAAVATTWFATHSTAASSTTTTASLTQTGTANGGAVVYADYTSNGGGATFAGSDFTRTAAAVTQAPGAITLTGNAPTGGTAPYSYQLKRSTTPNGTYANVTGATSLSPTDTTVTNGTLYCYEQVQTDSASNTYTTPPLCLYATTVSNINICWIGDSITAGLHATVQTTPLAETHAIMAAIPFVNVTGENEGVSGLATNDWVSGGSYLAPAITACKAAGANYVSIMLGTNDASTNYNDSTATFIANYDNITAYINAQMPGVPIIINAPGYVDYLRYGTPFTISEVATLQGYIAALPTITGANVHIGDQKAITYFSGANDYNFLYDGVHPYNGGETVWGSLWAQGFFTATGLGPSGGGAKSCTSPVGSVGNGCSATSFGNG